MSATVGRVASKVGQAATKAAGKAAEAGSSEKQGVLQKGAKRDPELYVCSDLFIAFTAQLTCVT